MRHKKEIILIFAAAFLIRAFILISAFYYTDKDYSIFRKPDTTTYLTAARELIASGKFTSSGNLETVRTPGYPLFLIPGILLRNVELITVFLQLLLSALTSVFIYFTAFQLFDKKKAFVCGILYAFEPLSIIYSLILLTESLFAFFISVYVFLIIKFLKIQKAKYLYYSAALLAVTAYIRPISYYLTFFSFFVLAAILIKTNFKCNMIRLVVYLLIALCLLGMWQFRNYIHTGHFKFTSIQGANLYLYKAAAIIGLKEGLTQYEVTRRLSEEMREYDLTDMEKDDLMQKKGKKIISENFFLYLKIHFNGIIRTVYDPGATEYAVFYNHYMEGSGLLDKLITRGVIKTAFDMMKEQPVLFWTNLLFMGIWAFYLMLFILALFFGKIIKRKEIVFILAMIFYFLIISGGPQTYSRFRHPVMPAFCVIAGLGYSILKSKIFKPKT